MKAERPPHALGQFLGVGVGVSMGMLPVKYFCSNKAPSLCQSNSMEIIRLLQR